MTKRNDLPNEIEVKDMLFFMSDLIGFIDLGEIRGEDLDREDINDFLREVAMSYTTNLTLEDLEGLPENTYLKANEGEWIKHGNLFESPTFSQTEIPLTAQSLVERVSDPPVVVWNPTKKVVRLTLTK